MHGYLTLGGVAFIEAGTDHRPTTTDHSVLPPASLPHTLQVRDSGPRSWLAIYMHVEASTMHSRNTRTFSRRLTCSGAGEPAVSGPRAERHPRGSNILTRSVLLR